MCEDGRKEIKKKGNKKKTLLHVLWFSLETIWAQKPGRKDFLVFFFILFFLFLFSFFQLEGRLEGLRLAHICCSSLLAFNTTQAQLPPRWGGKEKDRRWEWKFYSDIKALLHWIKTVWNNCGREKGCLVRMGERTGTVGWWEEGIRMDL